MSISFPQVQIFGFIVIIILDLVSVVIVGDVVVVDIALFFF